MSQCQGGTSLASRAVIIAKKTKIYIYLILYSYFEYKHLLCNLELASRQQCPSTTDQSSPAYGCCAAVAAVHGRTVTSRSACSSGHQRAGIVERLCSGCSSVTCEAKASTLRAPRRPVRRPFCSGRSSAAAGCIPLCQARCVDLACRVRRWDTRCHPARRPVHLTGVKTCHTSMVS